MNSRERWLFALKPQSWPKIFVPAFLGQALGIAQTGATDGAAIVVGSLFTFLLLAYIVLLNDWGDREVDRIKRQLFPEHGGPKTIHDGILESRSVLYVGVGTGATALVVAIVAQILMDRQGLALATIGCLAIFFAYTFAPLKLNYRGGGELLEMLGLGFALPLWHAYLQSGISVPAGIIYLPAFALMCLASALASGLADEQSDRAGGKCTFVTTFGAEAVRQASEGLVLGAMIVFALLPFMVPGRASAWVVAPMLIVMAVEYAGLRRAGMRGDVATPKGTKRFKAHLHGCIWRGGAMLALGLIARALVFRVCAHEIGWLG